MVQGTVRRRRRIVSSGDLVFFSDGSRVRRNVRTRHRSDGIGDNLFLFLSNVAAARHVLTSLTDRSLAGPHVPDQDDVGDAGISVACPVAVGRKLTGRASSWRELLVIAAVGTFVVNLGYEFQGTCTPLGQYEFISTALSGEESGGGNRFRGTVLGYVPIPLPYQYLAGIDVQKGDFERGYRSFLHGEWKHGGWWYYYAYATLIKTPIAAFVLTLLTIGFVICGAQWRRSLADEMLLIVPGALLFLLISSQTGFAHHQRYVFPSFPFWFIWLSRCAHFPVHAGSSVRKATRGVIVVSVLWYVGAAVWYFPHNQGYFNELVGGPAHGDEYLLDSNSDWGQDLLFLKQWVEKHPEATPLHIAYFGLVDPRSQASNTPCPPVDGCQHYRQ